MKNTSPPYEKISTETYLEDESIIFQVLYINKKNPQLDILEVKYLEIISDNFIWFTANDWCVVI